MIKNKIRLPRVYSPSKFKRLSKSKKAVIVATDLLWQLENRVFNTNTSYLSFIDTVSSQIDAREAILNNKVKCEGCARGGLLAAIVIFKNEITFGKLTTMGFSYRSNSILQNNKATKYMSDVFSIEDQRKIEDAFEGSRLSYSGTNEEFKKCMLWHTMKQGEFLIKTGLADYYNLKIKSTSELTKLSICRYFEYYLGDQKLVFRDWLLEEICRNIIRNKGTFTV